MLGKLLSITGISFPNLGINPTLGFIRGFLLIPEKKSSLNPISGSFTAYL